MIKNIGHIDHIAFVSRPETIAENVRKIGQITGVELQGPWDAFEQGMRMYLSWESGFEIVCPLVGSNTMLADRLRRVLSERGEGVFAVVFGVGDMDVARDRATKSGLDLGPVIGPIGAPWEKFLEKFSECLVSEFMNTSILYGDISFKK